MSRANLRVFAVLLVFMVLFLQYRLWFERGGIRDMSRLKKQLAVQKAENDKVKEYNKDLMLQVRNAQKNKQAAEMRARSELGMVKKGETFYQIVEK